MPVAPTRSHVPAFLSPTAWAVLIRQEFPEPYNRDPKVIAEGLSVLFHENKFRTGGQDFAHSGHWGGWQEEAGFGGCSSVASRTNPRTATRCAGVEYASRGWSPWAPYSGTPNPTPWLGIARRVARMGDSELAGFNLPRALGFPAPDTPIPLIGGDTGGGGGFIPNVNIPGVSQLIDAANGFLKFITGLGELLLTPAGWLRIGKMMFGVIAILWGMNILIKQTTGADIGRTARRTAETAAAAATIAPK